MCAFFSDGDGINNTQSESDGIGNIDRANTPGAHVNENYTEGDDAEEENENKIVRNIDDDNLESRNRSLENLKEPEPSVRSQALKSVKSLKKSMDIATSIAGTNNTNTSTGALDSNTSSYFNSNNTTNNVNINNNNLTADKYSSIINSFMLGAGINNNLCLDMDDNIPEHTVSEKLPFGNMHSTSGHPLYGHGICKWPGCEMSFEDLQSFAK